jgi:hypothetical protein
MVNASSDDLSVVEAATATTHIGTDAAAGSGMYALNRNLYKEGFRGNGAISSATVKDLRVPSS